MNICRWGADVGSLGPFLYICGGSDDSSRLETVERFDPFANVWVPSVPMSSSRNGVGVTDGSGRIYALGTSCRTPFHCLVRKARAATLANRTEAICRLIIRFSIECRQTKTKAIALANHKCNPVNQSKLEEKLCSRREARETCERKSLLSLF